MSRVSLSGNPSGTGTFTIASPNSNTDRTLSLPDQTGTLLTGSGALNINASAPTSSLTLDASGNLGVGNTSALGKLDVGLSGTSRRLLVTFDDSLVTVKSANNAANPEVIRMVGDRIQFNTGTTGSGTEAARIDSSGNFGIGTASPTVRLHVSGSSNFTAGIESSNTFAILGFKAVGSTGTMADPTVGIGGTGDALYMRAGGTERARITSGGSLLVGTTSAVSGANIVAANAGGEQAIAVTNGTNVSYFGYANSNGNYIVGSLAGDATVRGSNGVSVAGNNGSAGVRLASGGTSWGSISDERLKDIIEPITNASEKVSGIRAVIGKYKVDDEGVRRSFLIAQDVQAVLPEAIDVNDDEQGTLSLKYTDVIPLLVAAIQELKADLDATKAELAALKGQQ
jgi:hypothetical protein